MAFGDFLGTKLIYEKLPNGDTTFSEIPGTVSSALGNPMTYQRTYNEPVATPAQSTAGEPVSTAGTNAVSTGGSVAPSYYDGSGNEDILATLQQASSDLDRLRNNVIPTSVEPTLGEAFSFSQPDLVSGGSTPSRTLTPEEEADIRRRQMRLFQSEVDATNQIYDQMLREAQMEGEGRLGSQRAMAARGGLLGSDFAGAQKDRVLGYNRDIISGIQGERAAAVASILGEARSAAADEIALKNTYRSQGVDDYLADFSAAQEARGTNINRVAQAMIEQGVAPEDIGDELEAIAGTIGVSTDALISSYRSLKTEQDAALATAELEARKTESEMQKTQAEIDKINADIEQGKIKTIGEGTMLYNTETGETFKNPKTYKPDASTGYQLGGGLVLTQSQLADIHATLNETRGQDSYANTGEYLQQFNYWVTLGGDPKDFVKEFEPDLYINPRDPSRSFLQQFMKKTTAEASISDAEELKATMDALAALSGEG